MAPEVRVEGARRLQSTLRDAAGDIDDLSGAHTQAGDLVVTRSRPGTPSLTGELRASTVNLQAGAHETVIGNVAEHAAPVHSGVPSRGIPPTPFLADAAEDTEGILPVFRQAVVEALSQIKGA